MKVNKSDKVSMHYEDGKYYFTTSPGNMKSESFRNIHDALDELQHFPDSIKWEPINS